MEPGTERRFGGERGRPLDAWLPVGSPLPVAGHVEVVSTIAFLKRRSIEFVSGYGLYSAAAIAGVASGRFALWMIALGFVGPAGFLVYFFYEQRRAIKFIGRAGTVFLFKGGTRRPLYLALKGTELHRKHTDLAGFLFAFADPSRGLLVDLATRQPTTGRLMELPPEARLRIKATASGRLVSATVHVQRSEHRVTRLRGRLTPPDNPPPG